MYEKDKYKLYNRYVWVYGARDGFNQFLKEQKTSKNKIKFSLLFFDTNFYMPYKNVNIEDVEEVNEDS